MIGIVALALVGGGAAMMMGGEEKPPEDVNVVAPAVAAPAPTPAPEPVVTPEPTPAVAAEEKPAKVTVSSEPAGAEVYLNGALLGNTPFTLDKPKGSQTIEIELREPGYTEHTVQIAALTAETVTIALKPKRSGGGRPSRPSATPAPTPAPTPGPAKTPSKRPATEVLDPWD
jgi:serine/threonine-protein kinase